MKARTPDFARKTFSRSFLCASRWNVSLIVCNHLRLFIHRVCQAKETKKFRWCLTTNVCKQITSSDTISTMRKVSFKKEEKKWSNFVTTHYVNLWFCRGKKSVNIIIITSLQLSTTCTTRLFIILTDDTFYVLLTFSLYLVLSSLSSFILHYSL